MEERWQVGNGTLRVACHIDDHITALAWHKETLCIGTQGGLVRTVDVESGSVVGDYYYPRQLPSSSVTQLFFDGQAIVAGFGDGQLHVWRGELPGFWGFSHSSSWVMKQATAANNEEEKPSLVHAHKDAITGVALLSNGQLVSSGLDGSVAVWNRLEADQQDVYPAFYVDLRQPVQAICVGGDGFTIYLATVAEHSSEEGTLARLDARTGKVEALLDLTGAPTSLAWDSEGEALLIGLKTGGLQRWRPGDGAEQVEDLQTFHAGAVSSLFVSEDAAAETRLFFSAGQDGRVAVWDAETAEPLWGLQGFTQKKPLVLADRSRMVTSAIEINPVTQAPKTSRGMFFNWRDPGTHEIPSCEALLFMDFVSDPSKSKVPAGQEERFWPEPV